jgi:hypothetical protein
VTPVTTTGTTVTYGVRRRVLVALVLAAGAAGALAAGTAFPGRALFLVAAAGALVEAARGLVPTLVAGDEGFEVTVGLRRERYGRDEVERNGALDPPSAGARPRRRANALEIDLGERLLVLPAYRLGAAVPDVVTTLATLRA